MVWTNAVGVAFVATLVSASDKGALFEFPEDGATNVIAWQQLSPDSAHRVCEETGFVRIPPAPVPILGQAKLELTRLDALVADGRLDPEHAARRRQRVIDFFIRSCRERGLLDDEITPLVTSHLF